MRRAKFAILILTVLIGGIILVYLWFNLQGKKESREDETLSKISNSGADAHLEKIRFVEEKDGRKTWELEAKSIQQYQDQNILLLEEVKMTYIPKEGQSFIIHGKQGKVHQDSKDMELVGDVVFTSSGGYRLKTHSVFYDHLENKFTSSDPVEIEGDQIRVVGKGMVVDLETKNFKVLSQVKTQWRGGKR